MSVKDLVVGGVLAFGMAGFSMLPAPPAPPLNAALTLQLAEAVSDSGGSSNESMWSGGEAQELLSDKWPDGLPQPPAPRDLLSRNDGSATADSALWRPGFGGTIGQVHLMRAYVKAAAAMPLSCGITPAFLAGVGQVESGNLGGRVVGDDHVVRPGVYGPDLTGGPFANISDTDGGRLDGVAGWDRAVGPMQFIPSTWAGWGSDGDGDGRADPQNVYDSALSAARYLCAGGRDLSTKAGTDAALWSYNQSIEYATTVKRWIQWFTTHGLGGLGGVAVSIPNAPYSGAAGSATKPASSSAKPSASASGSASGSASASASASPTPTPCVTPIPSGSTSASVTPSASPSNTPSATACPTPSGSAATPSPAPSDSGSSTGEPGSTPSVPSGSASPSVTSDPGGSSSASPLTTAPSTTAPPSSGPSASSPSGSASSGS